MLDRKIFFSVSEYFNIDLLHFSETNIDAIYHICKKWGDKYHL
jgi:hypothetical protein